MRVVGIDPGLSGAVAVLEDGVLLDVWDMPCIAGAVNPVALADDLIEYRDSDELGSMVAVVEAVHSMPRQGVASTFKFGVAYGVVLGVVGALALPVHHASPAAWKRAMGLSKDKGASRRRAVELWPKHGDRFQRVKDDGRAEAALIARWWWEANR